MSLIVPAGVSFKRDLISLSVESEAAITYLSFRRLTGLNSTHGVPSNCKCTMPDKVVIEGSHGNRSMNQTASSISYAAIRY